MCGIVRFLPATLTQARLLKVHFPVNLRVEFPTPVTVVKLQGREYLWRRKKLMKQLNNWAEIVCLPSSPIRRRKGALCHNSQWKWEGNNCAYTRNKSRHDWLRFLKIYLFTLQLLATAFSLIQFQSDVWM